MYNTDTFMIFNGVDFSSLLVVEEVVRSLLPGIHNTYVKNQHTWTELDPTLILVRVRLIKPSNEDLADAKRGIAGKLYTDEPAKLRLYDDPDRYDMAKLDGTTDYSKLWTTGHATLRFINYSGVAHSETGRTVAMGTSLSLNVAGTWKTKPIITVTFTSNRTGYKISNLTTGEHVEIVGQAFVTGNVLVINNQTQLVTLNGNPIMTKVTMASDFFNLVPGTNSLTSVATGVSITFNEAWL